MITTLMNKRRGLDRFSKLPDDGDSWEPNNLLKPGAKEKPQLNSGGPSNFGFEWPSSLREAVSIS